jgi:hypothetical protein
MQFYLEIVTHTPTWVFILLAFLIYQGIQALRPRTVSIWRLFIVPVVFIVMGVSRMVFGHADGLAPPLAWLVAAAALAPIGFLTAPKALGVNHAAHTVTRPGSVLPLVRNVTVFLLQYAVAVTAALHPNAHSAGALIARAVSGATAGYFIGWAMALLRHYRAAKDQPAGKEAVLF